MRRRVCEPKCFGHIPPEAVPTRKSGLTSRSIRFLALTTAGSSRRPGRSPNETVRI